MAKLQDLIWHETRVVVQNVRNRFAREHPLWVLHAIVQHALPRTSEDKPIRHWIRFEEQVIPDRIQKGANYRFTVVIPDSSPDSSERFVGGLTLHLNQASDPDSKVNFRLTQVGRPIRKRLEDIDKETDWPAGVDEVCLEFASPLDFPARVDPERKWLIDGEGLITTICKRLEKLFSCTLSEGPAGTPHWRATSTIPCFWEYVRHVHAPKSPKGASKGQQYLHGNVGPLYLRADPKILKKWQPWLVLGSCLGAGARLPAGAGRFHLVFNRPQFDPQLADPDQYQDALDRLRTRNDLPDNFLRDFGDPRTASTELAAEVSGGRWQPNPALGFRASKDGGLGDRLLVQFPARDRLVQQVLHGILAPPLDRLFEPQSHGYRIGRSVQTAHRVVMDAWRDGYTVVLESDIEAFFDSINWDRLEARLDAVLPRADQRTRHVLHALLRTQVRLNNRHVHRTTGLLQGSPLSPLLANLFLDPFDEDMTRRGFRLVRYADDFLVLCRDEIEARAALMAAEEILGGMDLGLKASKTSVTPFSRGLSFLGMRFGGGMDEALIAEAALEKTVYLRHPNAWAGVDSDALVIRERSKLLARVPFRRVRELVLLGAGGISARLVERCARRNIPVSFCTSAGYLQNVLWRHDQTHHRRIALHHRRHSELPNPLKVATVRALLTAKLSNYRAWLLERPTRETRPLLEALRQGLCSLETKATIDSLRGVEGLMAAAVFRFLNDRTPEAFRSGGREPGQGKDPWNCLLDFAYSLLFQRLNVLLRLRGLDPFLGFLHSDKAHYESLVCDLQEPFRARCDRWVLKLVNLKQIVPEDFETEERVGGVALGRRLKDDAATRFIHLFAQELDSRLSNEPAPWGRILEAQVLCIQKWVERNEPIRFFEATPPAK